MHGHYLTSTILAAMSMPRPESGVMHAVVFHDNWCGVYKGAVCNCSPNVKYLTEDEYRKHFGNSPPKL